MWIARDKDGTLCSYENKPYRNELDENWIDLIRFQDPFEPGMYFKRLSPEFHPELKWEDEPIEINEKEMS